MEKLTANELKAYIDFLEKQIKNLEIKHVLEMEKITK